MYLDPVPTASRYKRRCAAGILLGACLSGVFHFLVDKLAYTTLGGGGVRYSLWGICRYRLRCNAMYFRTLYRESNVNIAVHASKNLRRSALKVDALCRLTYASFCTHCEDPGLFTGRSKTPHQTSMAVSLLRAHRGLALQFLEIQRKAYSQRVNEWARVHAR